MELGRVGVWSPSWLWEGEQGREAAAELEHLGFGALWLGGAAGDLERVEELLGATERLVIATGIVNVWTEDVDVVTAAYARVSARYPGRLLLGIGAGHKGPVERQTGQRYARPYEKVAGYLDAFDAGGGSEPLVPRDSRVLAALGPRMLALAAARSAGAHPYLVTPEHTRQAREVVGAQRLLAPEQKIVLDSDPATAREIARDGAGRYLTLPNYTNNLLRLGFTEDDFVGGGSDRLIDALVAWGDLDTVRARVREHHEAGADHVCIQVLTAEGANSRSAYRALAGVLTG